MEGLRVARTMGVYRDKYKEAIRTATASEGKPKVGQSVTGLSKRSVNEQF